MKEAAQTFLIFTISILHKLPLGRKLAAALVRLCSLAGIARAQEKLGDDNYTGSGTHFRHRRIVSMIKDFGIAKDASILDVGCGRGHLLQALRKEGFENTSGCDWTEPSNLICNDFKFWRVNLNELDRSVFGDQKFDVVISSEVIEHLENPTQAFRNLRFLVKDSGDIIVTIPSCWNVYERVHYFFTGTSSRFKKERPELPWGHISMLPPSVFESVTTRASLRQINVVNGCSFLFGHYWDRFELPRFAYTLIYHLRPK